MDFGTIHMPLPALASITHRITGMLLVAGTAVLLYMLDESLASEAQFDAIKNMASSVIFKSIVFVVLAGLIYHTVLGVKHLIMDLGYGETLEGGMIGTKISVAVSAILIVLMGVWIW
ncbi:MAG: succinate dehydrogenase / fumarate reductase cytochrome b subunit [Paraglaciecola psychrophila]|jgi:succinate dehydrogenase / fumarate reductase cytochrome b subunit